MCLIGGKVEYMEKHSGKSEGLVGGDENSSDYLHFAIEVTSKFYQLKGVKWRVLNFFLFFYFWLRWVFVAACGLSLVAVSRGYSSLGCTGFSLWWLLWLQSMGSRWGSSSCSTWAQ